MGWSQPPPPLLPPPPPSLPHTLLPQGLFLGTLSHSVCVCVCGLRIQLGDNSFGWYYMDSSLGVDLFELSGYGQLCVLSRWSIELLDNSLYWFCMDKANRYLSTKGYCFSNCLLYNCWRIWYKLSDWTWFFMTWVRRQSLKLVKYMSH